MNATLIRRAPATVLTAPVDTLRLPAAPKPATRATRTPERRLPLWKQPKPMVRTDDPGDVATLLHFGCDPFVFFFQAPDGHWFAIAWQCVLNLARTSAAMKRGVPTPAMRALLRRLASGDKAKPAKATLAALTERRLIHWSNDRITAMGLEVLRGLGVELSPALQQTALVGSLRLHNRTLWERWLPGSQRSRIPVPVPYSRIVHGDRLVATADENGLYTAAAPDCELPEILGQFKTVRVGPRGGVRCSSLR